MALYSRPPQTSKSLKQLCGTKNSAQDSANAFWPLSARRLTLPQVRFSCTPVSTLRRYIQAMGGDLDIVARFPEGEIHIDVFQDIDTLLND